MQEIVTIWSGLVTFNSLKIDGVVQKLLQYLVRDFMIFNSLKIVEL